MKSFNFKRTKMIFVFVVAYICVICFMSACSEEGTQNVKTEKNKDTTPAVSDGVLLDGDETSKPEVTPENEDDLSSVESDVPTAVIAIATESSSITPNISATDKVEEINTFIPTEITEPVNTSNVATAKPTVTSQITVRPTSTVQITSKPVVPSQATPKVTENVTQTPAIVTNAPTVVPTVQPTANAQPTPTPIAFPVINAAIDSNYNSEEATVVSVSESSTTISNNNGGVSQVSNGDIYIKIAGEYDFSGVMKNRSIIVQAPETEKIVINLKGLNISTNVNAPILVISADKVEISAKKETNNIINDNRVLSSGDEASGGAIYSDCDLVIKGKGSLVVNSIYNNGIATKKDLEVKNLTLKITAPNDALRGNDSVTILSGNIALLSTGGNGIETKNSNISNSGKQRGNVIISSGTINIKAKNDGINAAYSVTVSKGILIIEAEDYAIDAAQNITISSNSEFTDKSGKGCNPTV